MSSKFYVHDRPNLKLPALKINKQKARDELEKNPHVINFRDTQLLLNPDFYKLFNEILKKSKDIEELIDSFVGGKAWYSYGMSGGTDLMWKHDFELVMDIRQYFFDKESIQKLSKRRKTKIDLAVIELSNDYNKNSITKIKRLSSQIQSALTKYEKKSRTTINILASLTLFVCAKCKQLVSKDRFRQSTCPCCSAKINSISKTISIPIAYIDSSLRNFITTNYWLEYGIDYLLRKKNFDTLCGYHVLGHSGNIHEIDNIAESKSDNFRFFCECKVGELKVSDVFVFAGKMADIGCSRGYIFTLSENVSKEIVHLARSRNIAIIDEVLKKSDDQLTKEINI